MKTVSIRSTFEPIERVFRLFTIGRYEFELNEFFFTFSCTFHNFTSEKCFDFVTI